MCTRHLRRRGIQTIARRRKRAASGGGMVRGSCLPTEFRSPSSHRASGIVRHEGHQISSKQLFGSSRFDRDHLTASDGGERHEGRRAHRAMYASGWQRGPSRAAREGQSRGCGLALAPPARTPARSWPPIGRRSPFTAVLVIHGLPRREQSWSPSTDGLSGAIRCGAREATWSTDRAGRRARHQRCEPPPKCSCRQAP